MKGKSFCALALSWLLLAGCAGMEGPAPTPTPIPGPVDGPPWFASYRVVSGAETGDLILAGYEGARGEVYTLNTENLPLDQPLENGQVVNVYYEAILESYPMQFSGVVAIEQTREARDDRCGLYLQVLDDLWENDAGLNEDITHLGVDLSGLTHLSESEKSAVAYAFGMEHGILPLEATWDELVEDGYIDGENLLWEDGVLYSITTDEDALWNLPLLAPGEESSALAAFDAQKWRSGLGAYFFGDCTAQRAGDGTWTYSAGYEAIS